MEELELGIGEALTRKADFGLADPPYSVPIDRNAVHAACGVEGSNDVMYMVKVLGRCHKSKDTRVPVLFCSTIFCGMRLFLRSKRKRETVPNMIPARASMRARRARV